MADFSGPFSSDGRKPNDEDDPPTSYEPQTPNATPKPTPSPGGPRRAGTRTGVPDLPDDTLGPPLSGRGPKPGPAPRRPDRGAERGADRTGHQERLSAGLHDESRSAPAIDLGWRPELVDTNNPLLDAARVTMVLVMRLRLAESAPPVDNLREVFDRHLADFERTLGRARMPRDEIKTASYLLCTFVDEIIQSETIWGQQSGWGNPSLSSRRHQDAKGGERFFAFAGDALKEPERSLDLLEFMYICLCFGFRGVLRTARDGERKLEDYRDRLYREIRSLRGEGERDLSLRWQGVQERRSPIAYVPLWVIGSVCSAVLVVAFLALRLSLVAVAAPVESALNAMGRDKLDLVNVVNAAPVEVATTVRRLKSFLPDEITQRLITVDEFPDRSLVRLNSDRCFASGSATVEPAFLATLGRVGAAITQVAGTVEVVGHSDNQPISSLRFASNLELSRARAQGVLAALVQAGVPETRLRADGRGDAEPLPGADNATTAGRGRNRRVEIIVYEGMTSVSASYAPSGAPAPVSGVIVPR